jgi:diaminohydroxyphosphoribosylaminopyrimidine deaminase/5-amino-6-(5-phosphoribosylamino)uracil reductase
MLAELGITRLMVEGGPTVAASFVAADLVDDAILLRAEKPIGATGIDPLADMSLDSLTGRLTLQSSEKLGVDTIEHFTRV